MNEAEYKRIYWASRRGMLELDLIMVPFVKDCLPQLPEQEQQDYVRLLESEDSELFVWLMGREQPEDVSLQPIVSKIIEHARQQ